MRMALKASLVFLIAMLGLAGMAQASAASDVIGLTPGQESTPSKGDGRAVQLDEARATVSRALATGTRQQDADFWEAVKTIEWAAHSHHNNGRYEEAEALYRIVLEANEKVRGREHPETLSFINNLAGRYAGEGRLGDAEAMYLRAVEASQRTLGEDHFDSLVYAGNLADFYSDLGQLEKGASLARSVFEASERTLGWEDPFTLLNASNLVSIYVDQGRIEEAKSIGLRALETSERVLGRDGDFTIFIVTNLAALYWSEGRLDEAEALYLRALEVRKLSDGEDHYFTLTLSLILANFYESQGQFSKAELLYWRAYLGLRQKFPENHPDIANSYVGLARLFGSKYSDLSRSAYFYKRAVNAIQGVRHNMGEIDAETQRSFLDNFGAAYSSLQKILIEQGRFTEAEQVGRMFKDLEYTAFVRGARQDQATEQLVLNEQERAWQAQLTGWLDTPNRLGIERTALLTKKREQGLSELEDRQLADLDAAHSAAYEEFFTLVASWTSQPQTINDEAIREEARALALEQSRAARRIVSEIGSDVALLQAVAFEDSLHLFLITGEAFTHEEIAVSRSELFATIFDARYLIDLGRSYDFSGDEQRAEDLHLPLGHLYRYLIAPIEDELEAAGTSTLMLNVQGQIRYIPFAALWDGDEYLTEKLRLAIYTPAANTRFEVSSALTSAQGFGLSNAAAGFSPLPSVPLELEYVIGSAESPGILNGEYFLNERFSRATFEDKLTDPAPVLHIATHFQIQPGDEASSFLLLGDGTEISLAEINRSYKFDLEGVELLTLSACETAIGAESTGLELEGFAVLAQNKGAASVLATLWQVSDDATPVFMRAFYGEMVEGRMSKADALREAQLEMIKSDKYSDPYFWAPFVLMGNWM